MSVGVPLTLTNLDQLLANYEGEPSEKLASNEEFWKQIRQGYKLKEDYINLENGYYCIQPQETLEHFINHVREVNFQGSWYMRSVRVENKKKSAQKLAELAGCSSDELIITRNATESLDLVIAGVNWKKRDETVMAEQDYGAMLNQFKLMEKRHGIVAKRVSLPNHPKNDEEVVDLYAFSITKKTRLLMVCHLVNNYGADITHKKNM